MIGLNSMIYVICILRVSCNTLKPTAKKEVSIDFFNFYRDTSDRRSPSAKLTWTLGRRCRYTPSYTYIYIYRYRVSRVARWITTAGPTDLATALKSGLIYYYVLLLLFGYLYPYNIMPREIPRSRRYVTARLPRDRDLIFRIGHNLGRTLCQILSIASTLSRPVEGLSCVTSVNSHFPYALYKVFRNWWF